MPYCSKCEFEYREGVVRCPDCGELLAAAPPPEGAEEPWRPDPDTELVTLCRGIEPGEAEVMREVLDQAGIACSVKTFGPITGAYLATVTDGATHDYCTIMVAKNRLEEAERVLEEARSAPCKWPEGMEPEEGGTDDDLASPD